VTQWRPNGPASHHRRGRSWLIVRAATTPMARRRPATEPVDSDFIVVPVECPAAPLCAALDGAGRSYLHNSVPRTSRRGDVPSRSVAVSALGALWCGRPARRMVHCRSRSACARDARTTTSHRKTLSCLGFGCGPRALIRPRLRPQPRIRKRLRIRPRMRLRFRPRMWPRSRFRSRTR